jgi:D-alanyl-D-alanine carboxypeptidase (penicillin-binding protein 4)
MAGWLVLIPFFRVFRGLPSGAAMRLAVLGLLLLATAIRADDLADQIRAITDTKEYKPARWGILVVDAESGRTVYEHNPDKIILPASVTKLFTCATALCELGPGLEVHHPRLPPRRGGRQGA